jgi:hypothetical protein
MSCPLCGGPCTLSVPTGPARSRVVQALCLVAVLVLAVALVCGEALLALGRWLSAPPRSPGAERPRPDHVRRG